MLVPNVLLSIVLVVPRLPSGSRRRGRLPKPSVSSAYKASNTGKTESSRKADLLRHSPVVRLAHPGVAGGVVPAGAGVEVVPVAAVGAEGRAGEADRAQPRVCMS